MQPTRILLVGLNKSMNNAKFIDLFQALQFPIELPIQYFNCGDAIIEIDEKCWSERWFQRAYIGELVPSKDNEMGSVRVLSMESKFSKRALSLYRKNFADKGELLFAAFRRDGKTHRGDRWKNHPLSPGGKSYTHRVWEIKDFIFRGQ